MTDPNIQNIAEKHPWVFGLGLLGLGGLATYMLAKKLIPPMDPKKMPDLELARQAARLGEKAQQETKELLEAFERLGKAAQSLYETQERQKEIKAEVDRRLEAAWKAETAKEEPLQAQEPVEPPQAQEPDEPPPDHSWAPWEGASPIEIAVLLRLNHLQHRPIKYRTLSSLAGFYQQVNVKAVLNRLLSHGLIEYTGTYWTLTEKGSTYAEQLIANGGAATPPSVGGDVTSPDPEPNGPQLHQQGMKVLLTLFRMRRKPVGERTTSHITQAMNGKLMTIAARLKELERFGLVEQRLRPGNYVENPYYWRLTKKGHRALQQR